jgi:formyl-CoA transferase
MGHPEWAERPEWKTQQGRSADRAALNATIGEVTVEKPAAYWVALFDQVGIPCGPIYRVDQVFADPQVQFLGVATKLPDGRQVMASPVNMSGVSKAIRSGTPDPTEHTEEVLRDIGYSDAEIAGLRERRVV